MKRIITTLTVCLLSSLATWQGSAQEARPDELSVNTAEISQIEFCTTAGDLSFAVAGRRYILVGSLANGDHSDALLAANLAILNELRHAAKVTLRLRSAASAQPCYLAGITFNYDSLR